jgi:hypothetical protein
MFYTLTLLFALFLLKKAKDAAAIGAKKVTRCFQRSLKKAEATYILWLLLLLSNF